MRVRALLAAAVLAASGGAVALAMPSRDDVPVSQTGTSSLDARVVPPARASLSQRMVAADAAVRAALPAWPREQPPPAAVTGPAQELQLDVRRLARHPALYGATVVALPARLRRTTREAVRAQRALWRLAAGWPPHRIVVGEPEPLASLMSHYRAGQRRFGVGWHVLAAVNFVESAFGKLRNDSVSGAQGPMQFMPATWRAYGMGGDIHDPHDAILGAANMLRADGAPRAYARALFAYNPSPLYVSAVRRYARLIAADPAILPLLYAWRVRT